MPERGSKLMMDADAWELVEFEAHGGWDAMTYEPRGGGPERRLLRRNAWRRYLPSLPAAGHEQHEVAHDGMERFCANSRRSVQ